jgi:hypothetical protein
MNNELILLPMLAMVVLTFAVAGVMFARRIAVFKADRIHPQRVATSRQMAELVVDSRAADNFRNLFELPVLFYAALLLIYAAKWTNPLMLTMAWAYVMARVVHSAVHCTSNIVMQRFYAFLASCTILLGIWLAIGVRLFFPG